MHICIEAKGTEHDEPLVTLDMKQTPIRKSFGRNHLADRCNLFKGVLLNKTSVTDRYNNNRPAVIPLFAHSVSKTARRIYTIRQIHHPQEKQKKKTL